MLEGTDPTEKQLTHLPLRLRRHSLTVEVRQVVFIRQNEPVGILGYVVLHTL